ncbi:MAG TPA: class I tRNA ligase family protein, partial [Candidatus Binatus sp.]|nr:class I tRNA ligase family protein [Candidatus Binatus sp.]
MSKFYVTTAIAYVYDAPALHHIYEFVATDVLARYHRMIGDDTFFLTGTDEHSQNVERRAREQGVSPQEFSSRMAEV